jgi:iron complex transport system substrate-binding protein
MYDSRQGEQGLAALATVPTWAGLPAVQAGQIVPWRALQVWNYPAYATDFEVLAGKIRGANPDLVR